MRIVHVIPALTRGGAERVVIDLANHAVGRGHSVSILCLVAAEKELIPRVIRPEVDVRYIVPSRRSRRVAYVSLPLWLARNHRWLFNRDVIHCHLTAGSVFGSLVQALRRAVPRPWPVVVETYHAVGMAISRRQRALHAALLSRRDAVAFMAEDPYWIQFQTARPNGLFRTIPNGIVPLPDISRNGSDRFRRQRTSIPGGATIVGGIGRLVRARRPDLLIETFARLVRLAPGLPLHLLLAGEGPERARLEEQARDEGIADRVHLPGLVLDPTEPLGLIDLYLTVNVGDTTGIAALEAAFAGVPAIALQLRPDYVAGATDWIPSFRGPEELARQATALIADQGALDALASSQQHHVKTHLGIEPMVRAYDELYATALGHQTRARRRQGNSHANC